MERMWIDQPSTLQPLHKYHATNVLAVAISPKSHRVYFLSGPVAHMIVPSHTLSSGWVNQGRHQLIKR